MDQRQTSARALPAKRHRNHEQRLTVIYQGKRFQKQKKNSCQERANRVCILFRSIKTTRADTRVHPITHRVPKAHPGKWKCWWENRQRSPLNRRTCTSEKSANRWKCIATHKKPKAHKNPRFNGKEWVIRSRFLLRCVIIIYYNTIPSLESVLR